MAAANKGECLPGLAGFVASSSGPWWEGTLLHVGPALAVSMCVCLSECEVLITLHQCLFWGHPSQTRGPLLAPWCAGLWRCVPSWPHVPTSLFHCGGWGAQGALGEH